jgi:hypothetical protein
VAAILGRAFPDLTKATIARLVVLVYICFDLVEHDEREFRIKGNKWPFTPSAVYQKIKGRSLRSRGGKSVANGTLVQ